MLAIRVDSKISDKSVDSVIVPSGGATHAETSATSLTGESNRTCEEWDLEIARGSAKVISHPAEVSPRVKPWHAVPNPPVMNGGNSQPSIRTRGGVIPRSPRQTYLQVVETSTRRQREIIVPFASHRQDQRRMELCIQKHIASIRPENVES